MLSDLDLDNLVKNETEKDEQAYAYYSKIAGVPQRKA